VFTRYSEIAMRIPLDNWGAYESYLANKPIVTKTLINVIIYLLGDWLSQTIFQKRNILEFDIQRTFRNGFIGLCFGPLVHEYYQFSDSILPPEDGIVTRLEKIVMDQTIYLTVKCSIYISAVGLLSGKDWPTVQQTVKDKIFGIVLTAWKFWPLVHCITYGLIPARHRILWVNSVDLVWNAILASMASKVQNDVPEIEEATEIEAITRIEYANDSINHNGSKGGNETYFFSQDTVSIQDHPVMGRDISNSTAAAVLVA
jgi:protein Mpv17